MKKSTFAAALAMLAVFACVAVCLSGCFNRMPTSQSAVLGSYTHEYSVARAYADSWPYPGTGDGIERDIVITLEKGGKGTWKDGGNTFSIKYELSLQSDDVFRITITKKALLVELQEFHGYITVSGSHATMNLWDGDEVSGNGFVVFYHFSQEWNRSTD